VDQVLAIGSKLLVFVDKEAKAGYSYESLSEPMHERFNNVRLYGAT
jgi:hypothetical protein